MQASQVHDYATRLLREHGDKARLIAAQRVLECEKRGDRSEAEDWRRIRDTLKEMKGPVGELKLVRPSTALAGSGEDQLEQEGAGDRRRCAVDVTHATRH